MSFKQNFYLTWENGELVTADTMNALSDGIASQVLSLTDGILPVILSGGIVTTNDNTANVTGGYYRVANQKSGELDTTTSQHGIPGYFYASSVNNLAYQNGQYIVARINISTLSKYTTIISGSVMAVDAPTDQDVVVYRANAKGDDITQISRDNDLQLIIPIIDKSNQLIINNSSANNIPLEIANKKVLITAIAANATVVLPNVTNGIYSIINNSSSSIYLMPTGGNTIIGKARCLITPYSSIDTTPINGKGWIFL
ncbi:MAG: hypothetical protein ACK5Z5_02675 [Neisseriaceae bacterium]|jgi:hypothetical protein